jgi:dipeptidase E
MKLLLLSNSTMPGAPYLEWAKPHIDRFLTGQSRQLLFIPFAGVTISWDDYTASVSDALRPLDCEVTGIHELDRAVEAIESAGVIVIGGGNTFQLLKELQQRELIEPIKKKAQGGAPLIGWSAGSNVCCPRLSTTNDMPIVEPLSFRALGLVPFQINAHYTELVIANHGGESRRKRLTEFMKVNQETRIAALPEGALLQCEGAALTFYGEELKVLQFNCDDRSYQTGAQFQLNLDAVQEASRDRSES